MNLPNEFGYLGKEIVAPGVDDRVNVFSVPELIKTRICAVLPVSQKGQRSAFERNTKLPRRRAEISGVLCAIHVPKVASGDPRSLGV